MASLLSASAGPYGIALKLYLKYPHTLASLVACVHENALVFHVRRETSSNQSMLLLPTSRKMFIASAKRAAATRARGWPARCKSPLCVPLHMIKKRRCSPILRWMSSQLAITMHSNEIIDFCAELTSSEKKIMLQTL